MNLNLQETKARNLFDKSKELQGFDVWRRLIVPTAPRTVSRRVDMHGDVHNPPKAKRLGELMDAISDWEKLQEKYQELGGQPIPPAEQCVIVLRMLPPDTPSSLVMQLEDYSDFEALKTKLEKQIDFLEEHKGSHNLKVQVV